jgi:hypothetical protein
MGMDGRATTQTTTQESGAQFPSRVDHSIWVVGGNSSEGRFPKLGRNCRIPTEV